MRRRSRLICAAVLAATTLGCKDSSAPATPEPAATPVPVEGATPVRERSRDQADRDTELRTARGRVQAARVLRELDADHDGRLSLGEATAVRGSAPAVFADFAAVDLDGDGSLSVDEITASLAGRRRPGRP